jgi:hypothetical protein
MDLHAVIREEDGSCWAEVKELPSVLPRVSRRSRKT